MARKYYTLAVRQDGTWTREFGDYSRATVADELEDYLDHDHKRRDLKILCTADDDASIQEAVNQLNA